VILEVAFLDLFSGSGPEFEAAFEEASAILSSTPGYISHELQRCVESSDRNVLLVRRETLEAYTRGFRRSEEYEERNRILHHFYQPFPTVEHFELVNKDQG
jgi:heme-degrading monooxygenase HmoA